MSDIGSFFDPEGPAIMDDHDYCIPKELEVDVKIEEDIGSFFEPKEGPAIMDDHDYCIPRELEVEVKMEEDFSYFIQPEKDPFTNYDDNVTPDSTNVQIKNEKETHTKKRLISDSDPETSVSSMKKTDQDSSKASSSQKRQRRNKSGPEHLEAKETPETTQTPHTPLLSNSPQAGPSTLRKKPPVKPRRIDYDSGSDDDFGTFDIEDEEVVVDEDSDQDDTRQELTDRDLTRAARCLRDMIVLEEESGVGRVSDRIVFEENGMIEDTFVKNEGDEGDEDWAVPDGTVWRGGAERQDLEDFSWSEDFSKFSGQEETYSRSPGPLCKESDPLDVFLLIWDLPIVVYLTTQYNKYAANYIERCLEKDGGLNPHMKGWEETTVGEMYRFLAVINLMALYRLERVDEYWQSGILGMPEFRRIFSRNRFQFLLRFLHFVDNKNLSPNVRSHDRKIAKIAPIIEHCNSKFPSLYMPDRHLSLDESLLLWQGRLSWRQHIRSKAARVGIKSFDLCEANTGYTLRCLLSAGKDSSTSEGTLDGFSDSLAKVVLDVADGFLDVGHCLVMDNWYNQLPLTRHLKRRGTDVIGTVNRKRRHIPIEIKSIDEKRMECGAQISKHCGDITLIAWKDARLDTMISTYHNADQVPSERNGKLVMKPKLVEDYNKYTGGVNLRDKKLSAFHIERKKGTRWYTKVFRRLMNISLLNSYIIYTKQPLERMYSHRQFRLAVAEALLAKFPRLTVERPLAPSHPNPIMRLDGLNHFPDYTGLKHGSRHHIRKRCKNCYWKNIRKDTTIICTKCNVALCLGQCYREYHTKRHYGQADMSIS